MTDTSGLYTLFHLAPKTLRYRIIAHVMDEETEVQKFEIT